MAVKTLHLESSAFTSRSPIPQKYTGEGIDVSPPLSWGGIPEEAETLALIVDDPDAPNGTFDHWIVWNLPADLDHLDEGEEVPIQGKNHFNELRYRGPMPPPGPKHRYYFKLFALDCSLDLLSGASKEDLLEAMEGHVLAYAELIGTYQRNTES